MKKNTLKCLRLGIWLNKVWYLYLIEYHLTIKHCYRIFFLYNIEVGVRADLPETICTTINPIEIA